MPQAPAYPARDLRVADRGVPGHRAPGHSKKSDPTQLTPEDVLARYNAARERRRTWEAHWRFSCWNEGDANLKKITAIKPGHKVFDSCVRIARRAVGGSLQDPTGGATHYHHVNVSPPWSYGRAPDAEIGRHLFYKGIE